jgi:hypothetical protein
MRARPMTSIAARLRTLPSPAWVALVMVGLVVWWPLGLAILAYTIWRGKMGCCGIGFGHWDSHAERRHEPRDWHSQPTTSGNRAFDEYRAETLRRLEEEQLAFQDFLTRLRMAKDKAEFDAFMADRRARLETPASPAPSPRSNAWQEPLPAMTGASP